ncbi:PHD finger protein 21B isoform X2 [Polypterus senegalus]|uniref:PHD finger protein 21B isoform X2 n=1 Tax=Polypterus senegalus TaxID=55291 RepID=UPI001964966A|nr:PHD finger protein 21B isoform X2 [Polypterus senegalus]
MELQGLQEALKVEIQCHQNGDLKKQLHERQSRITALSEKQKLAVRTCPVGNTKPISLIKPPNQSLTISVVPAKTPVSMVTAHINGQKAASAEPPQTAPINLQTANKMMGSGLNSMGRRVAEISSSQMLGTISAVPLKVPQVSSLHRLAGQGPTVLPQVRPKTVIPDSLPITPCRDQPSSQPQTFQKATVVSIKNAALPVSNNTVNHVQLPNGLSTSAVLPDAPSVSPSLSTAGVAYAIISTSPGNSTPLTSSTGMSVVNDGIKVQPLLISAESKVIIIQPQVQNQHQPEIKVEPKKSSEELSQGPPLPAKKKKEDDPEKIAFMVALGLVTTEHLEEIQSKRQERKRRSTANPAYSGLFEPERKRLASNCMNNPLFLTRANEDHCWKDDIIHDDHCAVCKEEGDLLLCDSCSRAYHPSCIEPPLKMPSKGLWVCPKCQKKVVNKDERSWPENLTAVHSYLTLKAAKEEEKRKLLKRSSELKIEHKQLEEQDRQLSNSLTKCMDLKNSLVARQKGTQASLERLKALIRLIQRDQVIQVTMTATTTVATSLLTIPWIKPAATVGPTPSAPSNVQKILPTAMDNN